MCIMFLPSKLSYRGVVCTLIRVMPAVSFAVSVLVRPLARPFSASGMPCLACLRNVLIINALQKAMF